MINSLRHELWKNASIINKIEPSPLKSSLRPALSRDEDRCSELIPEIYHVAISALSHFTNELQCS